MHKLRPGEASDPVPIPARRYEWSIDPAGDELQLAAAFNLEDQIAVGFDTVHEHAQAVDAPHREICSSRG